MRGQIDGIGVRPRLRAADGAGATLVDRSYDPAEVRDLPAAIAETRDWLRALEGLELRAIGHRVVHGGPEFDRPVLIDAAVLDRLARYETLAPLHQPNNLAPIRLGMAIEPGPAAGRLLRHRLPPRPRRRTPTATPCRARSTTRASAATASTASATSTSPTACPRSRPRWRTAASSSPTSAAAPRCARCAAAAASRARWASPRSTACRWAPAPASSTPASCCT